MANAWLAHVKKTMRAHKGMKFSQVLKKAKSSYKKHGKMHGGVTPPKEGGPANPPVASPVASPASSPKAEGVMGGRRRRSSSRRTRRHRRR